MLVPVETESPEGEIAQAGHGGAWKSPLQRRHRPCPHVGLTRLDGGAAASVSRSGDLDVVHDFLASPLQRGDMGPATDGFP